MLCVRLRLSTSSLLCRCRTFYFTLHFWVSGGLSVLLFVFRLGRFLWLGRWVALGAFACVLVCGVFEVHEVNGPPLSYSTRSRGGGLGLVLGLARCPASVAVVLS